MWKEENTGTRVNIARTQQALDTGATMVAVGCPFCKTMIQDGVNDHNKGDEVKVRDIAEILVDSIQAEVPAQA